MTTKAKPKDKAKGKADTAAVTGTGNPGAIAAVSKPRGLADRAGKKQKAPPAPKSSGKAPEIVVDRKLPGHAARQIKLKAEAEAIQARVKVYGKMAKSKDKATADEGERLAEASKDDLKRIKAELEKSGLVVDEWHEARLAKTVAEERMNTSFEILAPILEQKRIDLSRSKMDELSSLDLKGGLQYIAGSMVTGLTGDALKTEEQLDARAEELRVVFGDRYDEFMERKKQQSLNMKVLNADPDFADGLYDVIIAYCDDQGRDPTDIILEKDTLLGRKGLVTARVMSVEGKTLFDTAVSEGLLTLKSAHFKIKK
jgi:hypothetical protein